MTGDPTLADFIAESHYEVPLPVSLFRSIIVAEPAAVRHISRTIAERMKSVLADPAKAAASCCTRGGDPYGFGTSGRTARRRSSSSTAALRPSSTVSTTRLTRGGTCRGVVELQSAWTARASCTAGPRKEIARDLPRAGFAEAFKAMTGRADRQGDRGHRRRARRGQRGGPPCRRTVERSSLKGRS